MVCPQVYESEESVRQAKGSPERSSSVSCEHGLIGVLKRNVLVLFNVTAHAHVSSGWAVMGGNSSGLLVDYNQFSFIIYMFTRYFQLHQENMLIRFLHQIQRVRLVYISGLLISSSFQMHHLYAQQ